MYDRNYANDPRVQADAQEQSYRSGAGLGSNPVREAPMAETMNRLMHLIGQIDEAVDDLDKRTRDLRQPCPVMNAKEPRAERSYSSLVGSLNEQVSRLERLHLVIRQITSELEI